ncbi:BACON domain-containing protein [Bacteroides sp. 519]|uniref:BACON domain-containing protein n=1 Tax=Bacteroides sp. 519 TaxID=2302937 RepID=UPI0013D81E7A|nr:BACON domain-containing carbohydrate-binding protein [Bacteroides sp. 519]NDV56924.1 DUF4906 domain-containing protein [Bacteroides sp. 519]
MKIIEKLCRTLPVLVTGVLLCTSCVNETKDPQPDTPQLSDVKFVIELPPPLVVKTNTRATTGSVIENQIDNLYLFAFDSDDKLVKFAYPTPDAATGTNKNTCPFTAKLPLDGATYTLMVVANTGTIADIETGMTRTALEALIPAITEENPWNIATRRIPMYGEIETTLSSTTTEVNIPVRRMLARVNVNLVDKEGETNVTSVFKLEEVYFYNYNQKGVVLYNEDDFGNGIPTIPTTPGKQNTAHLYNGDYITDDKTCNDKIYVFENAHVKPYGEDGWVNNPCIVVGGSYNNGATSYYRLDFIKGSTWMSVLRNHSYNFNITDVQGAGYDDPDVALVSAPVNMEAGVIPWEDGEAGDVIFDGQHYLSIRPEMMFQFPRDADSQTVTVKTNVPAGFEVTKIVNSDGTDADWLSTDITTGGTSETATVLTISVTENETAPRTGYIYIKAGRLEAKLTVTQDLVPKKPAIFTFIEYINMNSDELLNIPYTGGKVQAKANTNMGWKFCTDIEGVEASMTEPASEATADYTLEVTIPANTTWEPIDRKLWVLYKGVTLQETLFTQAAAPGVRTVDANNQEITELVFISPAGVDPGEQTLTVNWSPKDADLTVAITTDADDVAFPTDASGPTAGTITGGNEGTGTISYAIQPAALTAAELKDDPFLEKVSKVEFIIDDNVKTSILLRQLCPNLVTDVKGGYMLNGQEETLTVQANFEWTLTSITDKYEILQNDDELIGLTSEGGNTITLVMAEETADKSKTGKKATIVFTSNEDETSTYEIEITAVEALYVGRFGGALVKNGGVWQFEKGLAVQNADEGNATWGPSTASGVTDVTNGKGNTYALYTKSTTGYPAANLCFKKNANYASIGGVDDVNYNWFLPAQKQVMSMWVVHNSFDTYKFASAYSWSSTEGSANNAWYVRFSIGNSLSNGKSLSRSVRCAREL